MLISLAICIASVGAQLRTKHSFFNVSQNTEKLCSHTHSSSERPEKRIHMIQKCNLYPNTISKILEQIKTSSETSDGVLINDMLGNEYLEHVVTFSNCHKLHHR